MPAPKDDDVRFRLIYDGALPPKERCRADVKQMIRKQIHPQLENLWRQHPQLSNMMKVKSETGLRSADRIAENFCGSGFRCVPLVRSGNNHMACRLDVLVLLRQEPHRLFWHGDLDNRIKTLIDGLRVPMNPNEAAHQLPESGEEPFFCLLQDDKLIYEFSVQSDRLLVPPRQEQQIRDVVAIIDVHVTNDEGGEMPTDRGGYGRH